MALDPIDPNSSQFRFDLATTFADHLSELAQELSRSQSELKPQETEPDMQVEEVASPLTPEREKPEKPEELVKTEEPEKEEPQEKDKPVEKDEPKEKEEPENTEERVQMQHIIRAAREAGVALPKGRLEGASVAEQIRQQLEKKIWREPPLSKGLVIRGLRSSSEAGLSSQPGEPVVISARQGYPKYQGSQQPPAARQK